MPANNDSTASGPAFVMTRKLNAPLEQVWRAWSEADALGQWWGPKGCAIEVLRFEFRPGGFFHYAMNFPGAPPMWGRFNFIDIVESQRIVWLNSFANEHGGLARAPFSELCPLEVENTVTFAQQGDATILTLRAQPFGAPVEEQAFFEALGASLEQGYGGTFDQLADHLAKGESGDTRVPDRVQVSGP